MKQNKKPLTFSYLDVFFLLIFLLVLSFLLYLIPRTTETAQTKNYIITVEAVYEEELSHAIPREGETLFDAEGIPLGKVLGVHSGALQGKTELELSLSGEGFRVGEKFSVNTKSSVKEGMILSVEIQTEKGESET